MKSPITANLTLLTAVLLISASLPSNAKTSADVIVYGSTPGGYCAAIAAAREGASVILLEPTSHVGGMNTGGLSFSDSNQMYRDKLMGLFHEWHLRIQKDYESRGVTLPYNVNVKDQTNWSYEPHVATRVTNAMLSEAGVTVLTGRYIQSAKKTGHRITAIVTSNGTYTGRVFIDGSYEGDLMAAAGVSWKIGREGKADHGENLAGKVYPKPAMDINGRDDGGNPLPLIAATDAGPVDDGDDNLMAYSFRLAITTNAANRVPYPAPAKYDPARFEVMRRYIRAGGAVNMVGYDQYIVPNNKADGNNSIAKQFSFALIGAAKNWHTADKAGRVAIFEAHKQYTLEFLHFLANDPVFTAKQRAEAARWGLCADEFTNNGNFPPQLYVRESRRMRGQYVISQKDIIDNPAKPDPIMISSFPIDSHDCQRVVLPDGKVINEGTIYPVKPPSNNRGYAYQVPYRSILPQSTECDNLLVPVALSCTHVAMSSLRIEATWMLIGQSAGIAAAMAANKNVAVQDLPYKDLKPRLLAQGQVLTLPAESAPKPNVLMIAVDDLNDWVGCLKGHPQTVTPNIDRLASRGVLFTNAHCQGTLCNPSRISILWGRRPSSTGFYDNNYPVTKQPDFLKTHVSLPAHFAANGYKTMTAGKVFHPGTPAQSQISGPDPGYWRNGFDKPIHQDPRWHQIWDFGPQTYAETEFVDHQIASWVVARLGETHTSPFFLSAGFYRPHVPFFPPKRVHDEFSNVQLPPVKLDDWNDIPAAAGKLTLSNPKIPTHDWMLQNNQWNEAVHAYLACIKWTDEQVGRLLDALDNGPNANNTIIVLFSDQGYHLGEKQRWEKFSLWERTTRVPLIICVPKGLVGTSGKPVELLGIYPTLVELCGLPPNPMLEGVSLKPLLENPAAPWDHVAISTLERNNHAIRDDRWRYIRYADGSEELYDHRNDPNEWNNLAAGKPDAEQIAAMRNLRNRIPKVNEPQRGSKNPK